MLLFDLNMCEFKDEIDSGYKKIVGMSDKYSGSFCGINRLISINGNIHEGTVFPGGNTGLERIIYKEETLIAIYLNGLCLFRLKFENSSFYEHYRDGPLSEFLIDINPGSFMHPNYVLEESAEEELHDVDEVDDDEEFEN